MSCRITINHVRCFQTRRIGNTRPVRRRSRALPPCWLSSDGTCCDPDAQIQYKRIPRPTLRLPVRLCQMYFDAESAIANLVSGPSAKHHGLASGTPRIPDQKHWMSCSNTENFARYAHWQEERSEDRVKDHGGTMRRYCTKPRPAPASKIGVPRIPGHKLNKMVSVHLKIGTVWGRLWMCSKSSFGPTRSRTCM